MTNHSLASQKNMYLRGNPFVLKDQVCQAIKFVAYG